MARLSAVVFLAVVGLIGAAGVRATTPPLPRSIAEATGGDPDPVRAASLDRRRAVAVARLTARCMRVRGLPYAARPETAPAIPDPALGPVEWADRWGFGLSTSVDRAAAAGTPQGDDAPGSSPGGSSPGGTSTGVRARVAAALYGTETVEGCLPAADSAVYGLMDRLLAPLTDDLATLRARERADPRTREALRTRAACLRSAGVGGSDTSTATAQTMRAIAARIEALTRRTTGSDPTELRTIQADERRLAGTIARCEIAFVDATTPVIADAERTFVRDNLAALLAIRAARQRVEDALPRDPGP